MFRFVEGLVAAAVLASMHRQLSADFRRAGPALRGLLPAMTLISCMTGGLALIALGAVRGVGPSLADIAIFGVIQLAMVLALQAILRRGAARPPG